ncbi:predicted protein [Aspergillus nidulans FGSC A4]|uniref:Uncharacterized protein n=1 Tax=Emericella nidulans (strain FGSC A4 / ATCC 38163 / CBS 112.46 / NRRL 194 / M139) TaxID=227321 RepID=Q5AT06_EMENI|nr:hypothetical protein [Aspergillus nidulans FGSC A4]EAA66999.1 predicted protein [Aspergillus nidulans FGSC A4]CBF80828.1 TPA: conserved hypothetical protein [Aspergillus nidulans FGSC A4]|eukprot:XP_681843.1 predicted protein [Aspergillus nidulans FGSC A4]
MLACGVAWQVWLIANQRRIMISYVTYLQDSIIFLSLIEAVQNSAKLDKQDIIQYQNRDYFGVHHSYRTANMEANYLRHLAREESRKRRRSSSAHLSSQFDRRSQTRPRITRSPSESFQSPSVNILSFEEQRQALELRQIEIKLRREEEEVRALQLQNEEKELEFMERRRRLQEFDF